MRLRSWKDRSIAFSSPTGSAPFRRSDLPRSFAFPLLVLSLAAGACSTGATTRKTDLRHPASGGSEGGPLGRAVLSISSPRVVDGSLLTLTLVFPPEEDPGNASLLSGSFGEVNFPFFPIGDGETRRGYGAMVGVPHGYPAGENRIFVHLSSSPDGRPEFTREQSFEVIEGSYRREILRVDPSKVEPPEHEKPRIQAEREELKEIYTTSTLESFLLAGFRLPVQSDVTSPYGSRRIYNGSMKSVHNGLDLRASVGRRVYSSAPGRVVLAKDLYYTGNTVIVDHGFGVFTLYAHLSRFQVRKGAEVRKGELLGSAGSTGRVTGPHLHWSAIVHQVKVNPLDLTKVAW